MNELNNFFLGVQQVAQDAVDKAPYDRTFRGIITDIAVDGTCTVSINGHHYDKLPIPSGFSVGHVVDVLFPQNNPSQMRIITPASLSGDFVPTSRKINGKSLISDVTLNANDVGARSNTWMPTAAQVGARPSTWTPTASDVGAIATTGGTMTGNLNFTGGASINTSGYVTGTWLKSLDMNTIFNYQSGGYNSNKVVVLGDDKYLYYKPIYETLWTGSWSSGSIVVPNSDKYNIFVVVFSGQGTDVPCFKHGEHIRGIGGYAQDGQHDTHAFSAKIANGTTTTWEMVSTPTFMKHYQSGKNDGKHSAVTTMTVSQIIGVI